MSHHSTYSSSGTSPQTTSTSPATQLSTTSIGSSTPYGDRRASSPYWSQIPVTREYVSPYPPLPPSTASAPQPTPAITSLQPRGTQSSSATTPSATTQETAQNAQKAALIKALNERRVNTIGELRRIERAFASLGSEDVTGPMTSAWMHYVNSNNLLTELRGLTRNYPFSSECVEDGKRRVHEDPASNRSWNYCWLVLAKIHTDKLIPSYARAQASRPEMWGGRIPLADSVNQLASAFEQEWNAALAQLLRYWETAPIR